MHRIKNKIAFERFSYPIVNTIPMYNTDLFYQASEQKLTKVRHLHIIR